MAEEDANDASDAAGDSVGSEDLEARAIEARRWDAVRAFLRGLPTVEPPIFPGPIPDRRAPALEHAVLQRLEPVRPLPAPPTRFGAHGRPTASARGRLAAPVAPACPKPSPLYASALPLRPPARRRAARERP